MHERGNSDGNDGPQIGPYYRVLIDQYHLDPIDIATLAEK